MSNGREPRVIDTFLALIDPFIRDFDPAELLTLLCERCVELLDVDTAGVTLIDGAGFLSVAASSAESTRLLEVLALDAGPGAECVRTGRPVVVDDLATTASRARWPRYAEAAEAAGFRAIHALPLQRRDQVIGALTLLHAERHTLPGQDTRLGQALADAVTVGLLHERAVRHAEAVQEQLQGALNSRVAIEQAKGVLAAQSSLTPDDAFTVLRSHARGHGQHLSDLARAVIDGDLDFTSLIRPAL